MLTINKIMGTSAGATIEITPTDMMPAGLTRSTLHGQRIQIVDKLMTKCWWCFRCIRQRLGFDCRSNVQILLVLTGLTVYGGISEVEQYQNSSTVTNGDVSERVLGINMLQVVSQLVTKLMKIKLVRHAQLVTTILHTVLRLT